MNTPLNPITANKEYHAYHLNRLLFACKRFHKLLAGRILEIGPWTLTYWLRQEGINVDTLGFETIEKIHASETHYEMNLSLHLPHSSEWPILRPYDLVIAGEIIEHLPVSMNTIMRFLHYCTARGGTVVIQTPNAAMLKRRIPMILGRNPFDHIVETTIHAHSHIREYTISELVKYATANGFEVNNVYCKNYFSYKHSWKARLYKIVCDMLPKTFHDGITLILTKPQQP